MDRRLLEKNMNEKKERIQKWDIAKAFLIFTVVLGHFADLYTPASEGMRMLFLYIYTFHMPVFLFLSGMFNRRTVNENNKNKLAEWLVVYVFTKLLIFGYHALIQDDFRFYLFREIDVPWFMFALVGCTLITRFVKDFSTVYVMIAWIVLSCLAGYDAKIGDFLVLSRIIVFFPFWFLGYSVDRLKLEAICRRKGSKALAVCVLTGLACLLIVKGDNIYWIRSLLTARKGYYALEKYAQYGFLLRLFYYGITCIIGFSVITLVPERVSFLPIATIGRRTLTVYALHYPVLYVLYDWWKIGDWFEKLTPGYGGIWILPVSVAVVCILSLSPFDKGMRYITQVPLKKAK